jgi:hypothetical protein
VSRPRFEAENSRIEARSFDGWDKLVSSDFVANFRVTSSLSSLATRIGCDSCAPDCKRYAVVPRNKVTSRNWAGLLRINRRNVESRCLRSESCLQSKQIVSAMGHCCSPETSYSRGEEEGNRI